MPNAAALVGSLLVPGLAALAEVAPAAAQERRTRMAGNIGDFLRGSLVLHAAWLAAHPLPAAPWVWSVGDAHVGNFATLATGPLTRAGRSAVTYGVSDIDDEHPTPWHWDLVRLMASMTVTLADGRGRGTADELVACCVSDYLRIVQAAAQHDEHSVRLDYHGLPEALKAAIEHDADDGVLKKHRRAFIDGKQLRPGKSCAPDAAARRVLLPAIEAIMTRTPPAKEWQVLDLARRTTSGGLASLGRRRWWVLARERDREGEWVPRLLEMKEHRPSAHAVFLPAQPFAATSTTRWSLPMGGDPWQRFIPLGTGEALLRTRCQARTVLDLTAMDRGDRIRLARLWGQLLALAHLESGRALGQAAETTATQLATATQTHGPALCALAGQLAEWTGKAHKAFRARS